MWLRFTAGIALAKRGASFSPFSRFREATPKVSRIAPLVKRSAPLVARSPLLASPEVKRETFGLRSGEAGKAAIHHR